MSRYKAYAEYKDSGVEWLGLVPQHWNARQLKFLCTCNDEVLGESIHSEYEIEYIDIGSVSASEGISKTETMLFSGAPSRARRIVRDGDVIISTVRTYLEAIASINNPPSNLIVSTGFAVIRPNRHLHKKFAAYCLRTSGFIKEVIARSVGVSYPTINASDLIDIKTPLPQHAEQEKIANFLDHETAKIDTLIAKQQGLIKLLKEKRQAVISHAVTKGLNPNAPMRDSGVEWLGEVPAHWEIKRISYVALLKSGDAIVAEQIEVEGDFPVFGGNGLRGYTNEFNHEGNYILIGRQGALCGNVNYGKGKFWASEHAVVVHPFLPLNIRWFGETLRAMNLNQYNVSAAQPGLAVANITCLKIPFPSIEEQTAIANSLDHETAKIDVLIAKQQEAIKLMQERRTALISAAVTGKIDVRNWQHAPVSELEEAAA